MKIDLAMMTKMNTFLSPRKIIFGNGTVSEVGKEAKKFGARKVLLVTDKGVVKAGLLTGVEESLKAQKIAFTIFDKVAAEPPAWIVDEGTQVARKADCDLIIGIGGGSSLDVAKGVALMAKNKGKALDYVGIDKVPHGGLPKILLPTTAGTGSEISRVLVITDEATKNKEVVYSDFVLGDIAIVDPLLTLSLPPVVTADTGMDALVHAIEAYVSVNATPFSDILAIEAIRLIAANLPIAYAKANYLEARFKMSLAATMAGMAFSSGGLGAVHALSNRLGTEFHLSHGRANAVLLPYIVDYNKIGNLDKYACIAKAMGENTVRLSDYEAAEKLVVGLKRLLEMLGIPTRISACGVTKKDIPRLVKEAMKISRLFVPNPRNLTEEDVRNIYTSAL